MLLRAALVLCLLFPAVLRADPVRIVTDIAPVHSLVSMVAGDKAEVTLLLPPGASPHGYALRPSEAAALEDADLVVWVGPALTPWLEKALDNLAPDAPQIAMMGLERATLLPFREVALFGTENGHEGHDGHNAHDDHDGHDHDGNDDHDTHDHSAHEHDGHEETDSDARKGHKHDDHDHAGAMDPHVWLDTANAALLLEEVAETLAALDPDNKTEYHANAASGSSQLGLVANSINLMLTPYHDQKFIVYHDAYQYFENRFALAAAGAVAASDADIPGPRRLGALQEAVQSEGIVCAFYEPQFSPRLIDTISEGTDLRQAELDPMGASLAPGEKLYGQMMMELAASITNCLLGSD